MALKAVFFDMDDTLVLTTEADTKACAAVGRLVTQLQPQVNLPKLLADWHVRFLAAPWDPTMQAVEKYIRPHRFSSTLYIREQVPVPQWRAAHWASALIQQDIEDQELANQLQECFDVTRINLFRFEPGVKEMVAEMRAKHLSTVIITNGHAEIQRKKLVACGAADLFDGILIGGEEVMAGRAEKPHPSIFLAACKLAGCAPPDAVHIGDSLTTDIAGGNQVGLRATIWVNRKGHSLPAHAARPTFIVKHVTELAELLPRLSGPQLDGNVA